MTITEALLTHQFGTRRGHLPHLLAVVHQTAVSGSEGQAMALRNTRERTTAVMNSATYYVDPDGDAVHAVDGTLHYAWGQGLTEAEWPHLDTSRTSVATVLQHLVLGFGVNECVWETIEGCGTGPEPWTDAQFETAAGIIAARARLSRLPITRDTVLPHRDLNTVDRPSDPWPAATREARMARLIARAQELAGGGEPMLKAKFEAWTTVPGGAHLFDTPGGNVVPPSVVTGAVVTGGETFDGAWRIILVPDGRWLYVKRADLVPVVMGGDPAFDAAVKALLAARHAPAPMTVTVTGVDLKVVK